MVQRKHNIENGSNPLGIEDAPVSKRSRRVLVVARIFSIIDVANGFVVYENSEGYRQKCEHGYSVDEECPLSALLDGIHGTKQYTDALEEQCHDDP